MYSLFKRSLDLCSSALGLLLLAPLLAVIALLVVLDSPGPVFYLARRVGRNQREFRMIKFRTMRVHADASGPGITTAADPRITRLGAWLRQAKLDELPQLCNVLLGQMSLVGPRPEDPRYVARYTASQRRVLALRPGITSLAAVLYRSEASLLPGAGWEEIYLSQVMPHKLFLDLYYLAHAAPRLDLQIILATFFPAYTGRLCNSLTDLDQDTCSQMLGTDAGR
ncbi:MAG: sugar transferase [Anaerolineae bacterium]